MASAVQTLVGSTANLCSEPSSNHLWRVRQVPRRARLCQLDWQVRQFLQAVIAAASRFLRTQRDLDCVLFGASQRSSGILRPHAGATAATCACAKSLLCSTCSTSCSTSFSCTTSFYSYACKAPQHQHSLMQTSAYSIVQPESSAAT